MNELSFEILNILYDQCSDDTYKIIDVNDILLAIPEGFTASADKVFEIVEDLATDGSVMLKYRDDEDICLSVTVKGKRIVKKERETRIKLEEQRRQKEEEERLRKEREEAERLERERKLEEAKQALNELKAQKKPKKIVVELEQQVEELEKEITPEPEQAEEISLPAIKEPVKEIIVPSIGRRALIGGLLGALIGNAIYFGVKFVLELLGI
ncbi:MAG: hypothetical protein ACOX3U_01320 [Christensenellales bacterium]|jgi:hypothetical protein